MKNIFLIILVSYFLTACQSAKDALTLKKKESADEFLVEKKSPLVLPPNYGELPIPEKDNNKEEIENQVSLDDKKININKIIKNSEPTSLEKSVLEKIK